LDAQTPIITEFVSPYGPGVFRFFSSDRLGRLVELVGLLDGRCRMARILFGNMVADARGKLGGIVYSRNTGGAYARQKVSPVQPRTPSQLNQRSRLVQVSKAWDALSQGQRQAWKDFSVAYKKRDVFGLQKQRTAQQMYMFCNLALLSSGYALIPNPPTNLFVDAITSVGLVNTTSGAVTSAVVTAAGAGYTSPPTVAFSGGGGSGATGTVTLVGTSVASITVTAAGTGYTTAPTVTLTGGGGTGATATATVAAGSITAFTITAGGSGYTTLPTVNITGGGGTGGVGTAVLTATGVGAITITAQGTGYTSVPTVAFTGGAGTGAAATAGITQATSDLAVTFAPSPLPQAYEGLEIWATQPFSVGRTFVKNLYRYLGTTDIAETSPIDISEAWEAVFGELPTTSPYKIGVRARIINSLNGARSEFASGVLLQAA
jgi:hypothetical protein